MSIRITTSLRSQPTSIRPGQTAQLFLDLITNQSPSEVAQIEYRLNAPGVVFQATGTPVLQTNETVFSTGSTSITQYALSGPPGAVSIQAKVTPATPPAASGTAVVLKPAALVGAAGVMAGPAGAGRAPVRARKMAARKTTARKAAARKTVSRKAVARKRAQATSGSRKRR